jgi:hypothetical protein
VKNVNLSEEIKFCNLIKMEVAGRWKEIITRHFFTSVFFEKKPVHTRNP